MSTNQPNKKLSTPGMVSFTIKDTNEKALQRAVLKQGQSYLDGKTVEWLDIELPLEFSENARRPWIDLIGRDEDGRYLLCELKFSNNKTDSPCDAEKELIGYYDLITKNSMELDKNEIHHKKQKLFSWTELVNSNPRLCIMADASYWVHWENKVDSVKLQHSDQVECFAIDIDPDIFVNQRSEQGGEQYTPSLEEDHWHSLYTYSY